MLQTFVIVCFFSAFSGDGIVSPRAKGIAPENAPDRKPKPHKKAALPECLKGILGAGGREAATGALQRREKFLVKADEQDTKIFHAFWSVTNMPSFANP